MHPRPFPTSIRNILWSANPDRLSLERDRVYIIHQTLMFGKFEDIRWLTDVYGMDEVQKVFVEKPLPIYTKPALHFMKNFILDMQDQKLDEKKYVKAVF